MIIFNQYKEGKRDKKRSLSSAHFKNGNIHNQNKITKSQNYNLKNNEFQLERKSKINKRGKTPNYNMNYNNHYNNNSKIVGQKVGRMNNINNNYIKPKRNNNKVIIEKVNYQPIKKSQNSHNYNPNNPTNINRV